MFQNTGKTMNVSGYKDREPSDFGIPVVNVLAAHDCPYSNKTTILVAKNVLQVKGMRSNLIPPFLLREAGLIVNDTPLIHVPEPKAEDHLIVDPESGVKIHMSLNGVFSGFETRALTK